MKSKCTGAHRIKLQLNLQATSRTNKISDFNKLSNDTHTLNKLKANRPINQRYSAALTMRSRQTGSLAQLNFKTDSLNVIPMRKKERSSGGACTQRKTRPRMRWHFVIYPPVMYKRLHDATESLWKVAERCRALTAINTLAITTPRNLTQASRFTVGTQQTVGR
jgi:hypothetical protein